MLHFIQPIGHLIDGIRINDNHRKICGDRVFWVKQRRNWSGPVAFFANLFFRAACNPVTVWSRNAAWQAWEIHSFALLHADEGYRAFADGDHTVWTEQVPGDDLASAIAQGVLSEAMLAAAARELRRVHSLRCDILNGGWSHGDPHLGNFLYDSHTGRARLIDFEVTHRHGLKETERHADDLLVFLQDLMGRIDGPRWIPTATCFLRQYSIAGAPTAGVIACLERRLISPRGISRIWWAIRTCYLPKAERDRRIDGLREAIGKLHTLA